MAREVVRHRPDAARHRDALVVLGDRDLAADAERPDRDVAARRVETDRRAPRRRAEPINHVGLDNSITAPVINSTYRPSSIIDKTSDPTASRSVPLMSRIASNVRISDRPFSDATLTVAGTRSSMITASPVFNT